MSKIQAIRVEDAGGADALHLVSLPTPNPGAGEVRVRHNAIGVNFIDIYHRSGLYPLKMPSGIGLEAAGLVEAIGANVTALSEGDRIGYCTGPIGAYADAHIVPADRVVKLPDGISDDEAAGSMLKGLTVQYLIKQIYKCGPDDTVLFHAGAGGVGQIAIQWLKHLGSTVITTVGSEEKAEITRRLGADHVIMSRVQDVAKAVREFTGAQGVPVVYDGVGRDTWLASLDSLRKKGLMVSFGNASGPVKDVDLGILSAKGSLFLTRPTIMTYTDTADALQTMAADFFNTVLDGGISLEQPTAYSLTDAAQAHSDLENRKTIGSIILRP